MVHCDDYGRFYIVDRFKQLIKYNGFQVGEHVNANLGTISISFHAYELLNQILRF